jgi:hypothetical protein
MRDDEEPKASVRHESTKMIETDLDRHLAKVRADQRLKLNKSVEDFQYELFTVDELSEVGVRQLRIVSGELRKLAVDPQMSIPDVIVQMLHDGKIVGFERIPVWRIFFANNRHRRGANCGRVAPFPMHWPNRRSRHAHQHAIPALLHLRLWFGRAEDAGRFACSLQPARLRYFAELFMNNERSMLHSGKFFKHLHLCT